MNERPLFDENNHKEVQFKFDSQGNESIGSIIHATVTDFSMKQHKIEKYSTENYLQGVGFVDKEWTNKITERNKQQGNKNKPVAKKEKKFKALANKLSQRSQS